MCGRYQTWMDDEELYAIIERQRRGAADVFLHREEVTPGMSGMLLYGGAYFIRAKEAVWGYPMAGGKSNPSSRLVIHARAESAWSHPAFRDDAAMRRVLLPASCYYEWSDTAVAAGTSGRNENGHPTSKKQKYRFFRREESLFLAGLSRQFDGKTRYVLLTTAAASSIRSLHDRMPLLIARSEWDEWFYDEAFSRARMQEGNCLAVQAEAVSACS